MHSLIAVRRFSQSLSMKRVARATSIALIVGLTTACAGGAGDTSQASSMAATEFENGLFVDTMKNLDLALENSGNLQFEQGDDYGRFSGDGDRVLRKYNDAEYITYSFADEIKTVTVDSFFWRDPSEDGVDDFMIEVSKDGQNYTAIDVSIDADSKLIDNWQKVTYTAVNTDSGNKYLRIVFPISLNDTNGWAPQLGSVKVSNI